MSERQSDSVRAGDERETELTEPPREEIAEPWNDADAEYAVLADLVVPAAQQSFFNGSSDWSALDTKALGILAVDAAAIAALIAVHQDVNRLWWISAVLFALAGALLIAAIWPRDFYFGPDFLDFHYELRNQAPLDAARALLVELIDATRKNDDRLNNKTNLFWCGLGILLAAVLVCLRIALLRPE